MVKGLAPGNSRRSHVGVYSGVNSGKFDLYSYVNRRPPKEAESQAYSRESVVLPRCIKYSTIAAEMRVLG